MSLNRDCFKEYADFISKRTMDLRNDLESDKMFKDIFWRWAEDKEKEKNMDKDLESMGAEWVSSGCTKRVAYFSEFPDVVFKFPLFGTVYDIFEDEEENLSYFSGCELDGVFYDDYCELEAEIYQEACVSDVSDVLAETAWLCEVKGIPVYVSEKVDHSFWWEGRGDDNDISNETRSIRKALQESEYESGHSYMLDANMADFIIQDYSVDTYKKLSDFIEKFFLDDFHEGNVGFDNNGKFKILDYSGYQG